MHWTAGGTFRFVRVLYITYCRAVIAACMRSLLRVHLAQVDRPYICLLLWLFAGNLIFLSQRLPVEICNLAVYCRRSALRQREITANLPVWLGAEEGYMHGSVICVQGHARQLFILVASAAGRVPIII